MNFNPRQANYAQSRNFNVTYIFKDFLQRNKNNHSKNRGYLVVLQQNSDQSREIKL